MSKTPFIPFSLKLESYIDELKALLDNNNKTIASLLELKEKSYNNFVRPLDMLDKELDLFFTPLSHLNATHNSKQTQEVYTQALPLISEYSSNLGQNVDIYNALKTIQDRESKRLNQSQKRLLELEILGYELSGAHLDAKTKERLKAINLRKSELSNEFSQNLLDATNAFELIIEDENDVKGIAPSDLESAKIERDGKTAYRFTLQMPSYIAYMSYGPNATIREKLYRAYTTRAPQNGAIIDELLALRHEMAQLLGFKNYAEYSLASKMAKSSDDVIHFLEELALNSKAQALKELQELKDFVGVDTIESYDLTYYSQKLKKAKYDFDEELYRPYFEKEQVVAGLFGFLEKLLGITCIKSDDDYSDISADAYDIYVQNELKARVILDLEARESKRGGAWMHNFETHHIDDKGDKRLASAFIVCNFPPSSPNSPSLLRHDDVVTLFHEMGHAIHHLLSEVDEHGVSGVNGVEWDAVEFPSQFLENFAYEPSVLKMFAKDYQSGETILDEMIDKIVASKNFQSALSMLRQIEFSLFDFMLHTKQYQGDEIQALLDAIRKKYSVIIPPAYNKFQNGFAHIFAGGYAAGYYSYKWAELLSADLFFEIVDSGLFHTEIGERYLNIILKKGGSESMAELFKELMGREVNSKNLLRLNGIV